MLTRVDITPKAKIVPGYLSWGRSAVSLPISEQDHSNIESLRDLEREFRARSRLDSTAIDKNEWNSELLQEVYDYSYPLRNLLTAKTTVKLSPKWLMFWEIYTTCLTDNLIKRMQFRVENIRSRSKMRAVDRKIEYEEKGISLRGVPLRSFHMYDNGGYSIPTIQKAINHVEFETGAQINWDWLAISLPNSTEVEKVEQRKNKEKWIPSVDGEASTTVANMRAWRNRILTNLKVVDVIVNNNEREDDKTNDIAFVLLNLAAGGDAFITMPRISSTAVASMIHLFTQCFEKSEIVHTLAMDRVLLCGNGFLNNLNAKHHKLIYEFCEQSPDSQDVSLFTSQYLDSEQFNETVDNLVAVNTLIHKWRYEYYDKLLTIYTKLYKSYATKTFENYIQQTLTEVYKDQSKKWVTFTKFNFFAE